MGTVSCNKRGVKSNLCSCLQSKTLPGDFPGNIQAGVIKLQRTNKLNANFQLICLCPQRMFSNSSRHNLLIFREHFPYKECTNTVHSHKHEIRASKEKKNDSFTEFPSRLFVLVVLFPLVIWAPVSSGNTFFLKGRI